MEIETGPVILNLRNTGGWMKNARYYKHLLGTENTQIIKAVDLASRIIEPMLTELQLTGSSSRKAKNYRTSDKLPFVADAHLIPIAVRSIVRTKEDSPIDLFILNYFTTQYTRNKKKLDEYLESSIGFRFLQRVTKLYANKFAVGYFGFNYKTKGTLGLYTHAGLDAKWDENHLGSKMIRHYGDAEEWQEFWANLIINAPEIGINAPQTGMHFNYFIQTSQTEEESARPVDKDVKFSEVGA